MKLGALLLPLALAASTVMAHTETMTREQTLAEVNRTLAKIQEILPAPTTKTYGQGGPTDGPNDWYAQSDRSYWQEKVDEAVTEVIALRDTLSDNPYIQVAGFTVGFPWGVSVDFTFPDKADVAAK